MADPSPPSIVKRRTGRLRRIPPIRGDVRMTGGSYGFTPMKAPRNSINLKKKTIEVVL